MQFMTLQKIKLHILLPLYIFICLSYSFDRQMNYCDLLLFKLCKFYFNLFFVLKILCLNSHQILVSLTFVNHANQIEIERLLLISK